MTVTLIAERLKEIEGKPHHLEVAGRSIEVARAYFESKGFQVFDVRDASRNGQDMTIAKQDKTLRVEVKTATLSKGSYRVSPVLPGRRNDDLMAIVLGSRVIVQPMSDHLRLCGKSGRRILTDLVVATEFIEA